MTEFSLEIQNLYLFHYAEINSPGKKDKAMLTRCPNCFREYESKLGLCPFCGFAPGDSAQDPQALLPGTILADRFVVGAVRNKTSQTILYDAWDQLHNQKVMAWEYFPADLAERSPDGLRVVSPQNETVFSRGRNYIPHEAFFYIVWIGSLDFSQRLITLAQIEQSIG